MITEENDPKLNYLGNDPGATKYGNFINYYKFHSAEERINFLDKTMFPNKMDNDIFCLDIGCNTGELTNEAHKFLMEIYPTHNVNILAIDIDPILIQRAKTDINNKNIEFAVVDIMKDNERQVILNFLNKHKQSLFDIVFCFSVTMWIHLNHGDDGLLECLKYISNFSRTIIIEPQPWHCYRNAQRRIKKSGSDFTLYGSLKLRSNIDIIIEKLLEETHKKMYESPNSSWKRKIQSFYKKTEL